MKVVFELSGVAMTDAANQPKEKPEKFGKKPLIIGVVLALAGAAGGFYTASSDLIPFGNQRGEDGHEKGLSSEHGTADTHSMVATSHEISGKPKDIAFIPIDPIMISLSDSQSARHLKFRAELEVGSEFEREVKTILPRVTDVLNSYLHALELGDLTSPLALVRLRSQMLRRVQVVAGKGRINDLLIMEFVLN